MSYIVFARKYRPQNFDEVVGQEHITDLLKKAIESKKIAHAYLFCGPRGIGKTSCARILAKSLNCEKGPTTHVCEKCSSCREIAASNSFDVIEIDGASNRGIDEIRTLRENVKFAPSYGRYKIYIVDEVHMLTMEAFNALLKTLEEPPAHAKFIFATTAPNKVPMTIISRCQRFDFKRIRIKTIVEALTRIGKKEKLRIDQEAAYAIGKASEGSLRDALSIFDQLSALSEKDIKVGNVFSMLGLVQTEQMFDLIEAIIQKNCAQSLTVLESIIDQGKDLKQLVTDVVSHFRNLMVIKIGGKSLGRLLDYPIAIKEMFLAQSQKVQLNEILHAIDTFVEVKEVARITGSSRIPIEVALAKLTYTGDAPPAKNLDSAKSSKEAKGGLAFTPSKVLKSEKGQVDISGDSSSESLPERAKEVPVANDNNEEADAMSSDPIDIEAMPQARENGELDLVKIQRVWDSLTHTVSRKKISLATYLQDGFPVKYSNSELVIGFTQNAAFQKENLEEKGNIKAVEEIFSETLKAKIYVKYILVDEIKPEEDDPVIKKTLDTFGGKVISRWHNE